MVRLHGFLLGALLIALPSGPATETTEAQTAPARELARFVTYGEVRYSESNEEIEIRSGQGALRTNRFYVDVVMRFQFQLLERDTEATVLLRTLFPSIQGQPEAGYRVHLSDKLKGDRPRGSVTTWNRKHLVGPAGAVALSGSSGDWQDCELRIVGVNLSLRINGIETTQTDRLDQFVGYLGFQVEAGSLRIRRVEIETLPLDGEGFPGTASSLGVGIQDPSVVKEVRPVYSLDALYDRVEGVVRMEAVVAKDGTVRGIRVLKSVHPDLDAAAAAAAKQWRFRPARRDGQPVAVVVTLELRFRIK